MHTSCSEYCSMRAASVGTWGLFYVLGLAPELRSLASIMVQARHLSSSLSSPQHLHARLLMQCC